MLTYRQLRERIDRLDEEHLDDYVSVLLLITEEIFPVVSFSINNPNNPNNFGFEIAEDVLDPDHAYLTIHT